MFKKKATNYLDIAANAFLDNPELQKSTDTTRTLSKIALGTVLVNDAVRTWTKIQRIKKYQKILNYGIIFSAVLFSLYKIRKEY